MGSFVGAESVGVTLDARFNVEDKLSVQVGHDRPDLESPYFTYLDLAYADST